MPLTAAKLEALSGHLPVVMYDKPLGYSAKCVCNCGSVPMNIWVGFYHTEQRALESMRAKILSDHGWIVMERARWKCQNCDKAGASLSAHHKIFRSHGRDDRVAALQALCLECHQAAHQQKSAAKVGSGSGSSSPPGGL
jgi:hypothetical protein